MVVGDGPALLIDIGLGPREIARRLHETGLSWERVGAVILTHTHGDHCKPATLRKLLSLGLTLWCHPGHQKELGRLDGFQELWQAGLVRHFDTHPFLATTGLWVEPTPVYHDSEPTFCFRIECRGGFARHGGWSIGYLADSGVWDARLVEFFTDVQLLALEFNHDEEMQLNSGRPPYLIKRVMGTRGHLSNRQAAEFLEAILARSSRRVLRRLVLLHLSEQCNRPQLALRAALEVAKAHDEGIEVHVASAHQAARFDRAPTVHRGSKPTPAGRAVRNRRRLVAGEAMFPEFSTL